MSSSVKRCSLYMSINPHPNHYQNHPVHLDIAFCQPQPFWKALQLFASAQGQLAGHLCKGNVEFGDDRKRERQSSSTWCPGCETMIKGHGHRLVVPHKLHCIKHVGAHTLQTACITSFLSRKWTTPGPWWPIVDPLRRNKSSDPIQMPSNRECPATSQHRKALHQELTAGRF